MRRRILLSLMTIAVVATIIGFGSWAVFNDTETAGPYTATAGSLDLDLDTSAVVPAEIQDLKPSDWHYLGPFKLHNAGGNPGVLDLHFMDVVDGPGTQTEPEGEADPSGNINDISNWIDIDWFIDENKNGEWDAGERYGYPGKLGDIESTVIDLEYTMEPSVWVWVFISFHLETDAGNEYQGDTSAFDIVFTLHQTNLASLGLPAGTTCVRLENKVPEGTWPPILDDDIYGSVCYGVGSDLEMLVRLNGLTPNAWHQLTLNGSGVCSDTDDQLASGSEQYTNFDSGFWDGGPPLNQGACIGAETWEGQGVYNFAYVQTDANGDWSGTIVVDNSGESDPADAGKVTAANPALPVGVYSDVKFIVKEVPAGYPPPPWPATYTPVLMEMVETLDFNLP